MRLTDDCLLQPSIADLYVGYAYGSAIMQFYVGIRIAQYRAYLISSTNAVR